VVWGMVSRNEKQGLRPATNIGRRLTGGSTFVAGSRRPTVVRGTGGAHPFDRLAAADQWQTDCQCIRAEAWLPNLPVAYFRIAGKILGSKRDERTNCIC
jgi:hypothetical protein